MLLVERVAVERVGVALVVRVVDALVVRVVEALVVRVVEALVERVGAALPERLTFPPRVALLPERVTAVLVLPNVRELLFTAPRSLLTAL